MVVCHTDLHGANLLRDEASGLFILDWENAMIAPPEHDMIFFAGDERFRDVFYPAYTSQVGRWNLDDKVLEFYFYRRALEDIAGFIGRVLSGGGSQDQDQGDLREITGILDGMEGVACTLSQIQAIIG